MKKENDKLNKGLHGGMLVAAAIFLFNPNISVFDLLPDFIACILIIKAISKASDLIPYFEEARAALVKLAIVSATRIPAWMLTVSLTADHTEQRSLYTVLTLAYAVVELICVVPAARALFSGFSYFSERYGCASASGTANDSCDAIRSMTVWMFLFKNLMAFLPDLCYLYDYNTGDVTRHEINWLALRPYFVVLATVFALVVGIIWLVKFIPYVRQMAKSEELSRVVSTAQVTDGKSFNKKRTFRMIYGALTLIVIGTVFNVDFPIDNVDIAPDFISALCYLGAFLLIGKLYEHRVIAIGISGLYLATSIASFSVNASFFAEYEYEAIAKSLSARQAYDVVKLASVIETVELIAVVVLLSIMLYNIAIKHSDFTKKEIGGICMRCVGFGVIGSLCAVFANIYTFLLAVTKKVEAHDKYISQGYVVFPKYENLWLFVMLAGIVWMIYTLALIARLKNASEEKYLFN